MNFLEVSRRKKKAEVTRVRKLLSVLLLDGSQQVGSQRRWLWTEEHPGKLNKGQQTSQ